MFFLAFVAVMMSSAGGYVVVSYEGQQSHDAESALQAQIERAKPLIAQTEDNQRQQAKLTPRLKTLENAQGETTRWERVLSYLTTQTPPQAWLTSVRCASADPKKPVSITFQGVAMSQVPVGELILRLQNSTDLGSVSLRYTQEKLIQQSKTTEFQVDAALMGTEPKQGVQEEKTQ
ncbi:MAG: hypothetical protein QOJ65_679 [Fimbriimonadaceae bacterium]|jgi:Tfp pilus assembly protein PilN|nr:hypothetical protein [Fimbriimonadaceae bacterium]